METEANNAGGAPSTAATAAAAAAADAAAPAAPALILSQAARPTLGANHQQQQHRLNVVKVPIGAASLSRRDGSHVGQSTGGGGSRVVGGTGEGTFIFHGADGRGGRATVLRPPLGTAARSASVAAAAAAAMAAPSRGGGFSNSGSGGHQGAQQDLPRAIHHGLTDSSGGGAKRPLPDTALTTPGLLAKKTKTASDASIAMTETLGAEVGAESGPHWTAPSSSALHNQSEVAALVHQAAAGGNQGGEGGSHTAILVHQRQTSGGGGNGLHSGIRHWPIDSGGGGTSGGGAAPANQSFGISQGLQMEHFFSRKADDPGEGGAGVAE